MQKTAKVTLVLTVLISFLLVIPLVSAQGWQPDSRWHTGTWQINGYSPVVPTPPSGQSGGNNSNLNNTTPRQILDPVATPTPPSPYQTPSPTPFDLNSVGIPAFLYPAIGIIFIVIVAAIYMVSVNKKQAQQGRKEM